MSTLAEQLDSLIAEHRLSSITLTRILNDDGRCFWAVYVQGDGFCGSNGNNPEEGAKDALASAIVVLNEKRTPPVVVPELEQAA